MTSQPPEKPAQPKSRRGHRRATVPGTGPAGADEPEPRLDPSEAQEPAKKQLSDRDREILEEKPPHY